MMPSLRRPAIEAIREFHATQAKLDFSYQALCATQTEPPPGHDVDHTRVKLGEGEGVFTSARDGLRRWEHFRLGWLQVWPPDAPIEVGESVALVARQCGLWWLNACRIVYVVKESEPNERFGFAYGTLPEHAESGEERFVVEWDRGSGEVWYDILAFSRPRHFLTRLGYPYVRRVQKRFARESAAAMRRAANNDRK
jgi:uncharacterized protein (UPF0548 family)